MVSGAGIGGKYRGQLLGAANQGPSSFKAADYVPPEILHDIPLITVLSNKSLFSRTVPANENY